jgi:hypothetical protein
MLDSTFLASIGTLIFSFIDDVSTSHCALTGNVSPVNGCLNVMGSEIIPQICLLYVSVKPIIGFHAP